MNELQRIDDAIQMRICSQMMDLAAQLESVGLKKRLLNILAAHKKRLREEVKNDYC